MPNSRCSTRECMCNPSFGKHRHIQMDDLLATLRQNVVELILQGDAVARQMWQMYSLFGEIFGKQPGPTKAIEKKPLSKPSVQPRRKSSSSSSSSSNGSSRGKPATEFGLLDVERSQCPPKRSPVLSSSFPDANRHEIPHQKNRRIRQEKASSYNPLIDTIGSLASDPTNTDDSDLDITFSELKLRQRDPHRNSQLNQTHLTSSDRDSTAGYAGSNSVDSGYKSLCTTPEVMDSLAASEVVRSSSTTSDDNMDSTLAQRRRTRRPRISQKRESSGSRIGPTVLRKHPPTRHRCEHPPAGNSEADLDQIMYFEQSTPNRASKQYSGNGRKTKDARQGINYYSSARSKRHATTSGWPLEKEENTRGEIHPHSDTEFYMNEPIDVLSGGYGVISKKKKAPRNGAEGKNGESAHSKPDSSQKHRARSRHHSDAFPKKDPECEMGPNAESNNTRVRLTEAAMHVLHMIEDFQLDSEAASMSADRSSDERRRTSQGMHNHLIGHVTGHVITSNVSRVASIQYHTPMASGHVIGSEFHAVATLPCNNATTSADLHIYEEIVYDLVEDHTLPPPPPPPVLSSRDRMRRETRILNDFPQDPMKPGGECRRVLEREWCQARAKKNGGSRSSASYSSS